ncbi:hypothetical protein E3N88_42323 [Mikania micrantha]|uniref:Uncharacterized protein n=1 Tax=Mikania micrantha TaxID=192012 RepID=A0A5N6LI28_9ASTR|nr:hypothetical protein E3N88_42322 [Mikania micrantha]KAD1768273.1 hypothetical protein E3N88_42323 [Mikania micrantha]
MVNVGENRARNGVTDCPESRNEEKFQRMELLDSSRYATERLRILRGTRWPKISKIPPDFFAVREALFGFSSRNLSIEIINNINYLMTIKAMSLTLDVQKDSISKISLRSEKVRKGRGASKLCFSSGEF